MMCRLSRQSSHQSKLVHGFYPWRQAVLGAFFQETGDIGPSRSISQKVTQSGETNIVFFFSSDAQSLSQKNSVTWEASRRCSPYFPKASLWWL